MCRAWSIFCKFLPFRAVERVRNGSYARGESSRDNIQRDICSGRVPTGISSGIFRLEEFRSVYPAGYSHGKTSGANIRLDIFTGKVPETISNGIFARGESPSEYPAEYLLWESSGAYIQLDMSVGRVPERVRNVLFGSRQRILPFCFEWRGRDQFDQLPHFLEIGNRSVEDR